MRITEITDFLKSVMPLSLFKNIIANEVIEYKHQLQKKGSSVSIHIIEDSDINLVAYNIVFLCQLFLNEEMSEYELSYLTDALLLSSRVYFSNEETKDLFELMTDPEINGDFTIERITELMYSALRLVDII